MIAAGSLRPAVVVVNPNAGRLSHTSREEVLERLAGSFRLEVLTSRGRGEAIELASQAADNGVGLVIAFGGDGHVNEVANGLAGSASSLGIVPGGTMNVFARALGIPRDPVEAVERLVEMRAGSPRHVPLGRMDDRYFTFSGGCGFDAETAGLVEADLSNKRRFGEMFFFWSAFRVLAGSHRHRNPKMTVEVGGRKIPIAMAIACNTGPYAYFLGRPVRVTPEVTLEAGLDLFALRRMRLEALPTYAWNCVVGGDISRRKDSCYMHDLETFTVSSDEPFPRHVDGETLEPADRCTFSIERDALRVIA